MLYALNDEFAAFVSHKTRRTIDYKKAIADLSMANDWKAIIKWLSKYGDSMRRHPGTLFSEEDLTRNNDVYDYFPFGNSYKEIEKDGRVQHLDAFAFDDMPRYELEILRLVDLSTLWGAVKALSGLACYASYEDTNLPACIDPEQPFFHWFRAMCDFLVESDVFIEDLTISGAYTNHVPFVEHDFAYWGMPIVDRDEAKVTVSAWLRHLDILSWQYAYDPVYNYVDGGFKLVGDYVQETWYRPFAKTMVEMVCEGLYFVCEGCGKPRFKARKDMEMCGSTCRGKKRQKGLKPQDKCDSE